MKKLFLFCTKLRMFLSEIPIVFLFIVSLNYTGKMESAVGLLPLIILLGGLFIFILIFLFRFILISKQEIKINGVFSSKDRCKLNEGRTLKLILKKGHYVYVEVWGVDVAPEFEWINKNDPIERDVRLFREKYVGAIGSIKRILRFFEVPAEDIVGLLNFDLTEKCYEKIDVKSQTEDGNKEILIKILSTL